jgi:hypothetical protein
MTNITKDDTTAVVKDTRKFVPCESDPAVEREKDLLDCIAA